LEYTRFEKARIVGARALQISMGAPTLIKIPKDLISPIDIAMLEFREDAIPITVKRIEIAKKE
jgi:DNA-directed RNA polymerase subunit K